MIHVLDRAFEKAVQRYARSGSRDDLISVLEESRKRVAQRMKRLLNKQ